MLNKKNNMYKIAVIDKEKAIYSILDEQKEYFINYTWFHFKSIKKFTEIKNKETFRIYLIDETVITQDTFNSYILKHFKELVPCLFILSPNNRFKDRLLKNLFMPNILIKPFKFNYLIKMVNQILISQDKKNFKNINLGNYVLNISEQTLVSKTYKKISLTDIEFKIFVKLAQHNNEYVKKDELLTKVWGIQNSYKTHSLETHIYRLRKKIANEFGNEISIVSKIGKYALKYNLIKKS